MEVNIHFLVIRQIVLIATLTGASVIYGCGAMFVPTYRYVLDKGNSVVITRWALDQEETKKIIDAQGALLHNAGSNSESEVRDALNGYIAIHQKLISGWYGLKSVDGIDLSIVIDASFRRLAVRADENKDNSLLYDAFYRIKPSEDSNLYTIWQSAKSRMREDHRRE